MTRTPFAGAWRIIWMSAWDQDYVDMDGPGHITFGAGRSGAFQFGMVQGQMHCRPAEPRAHGVEFPESPSEQGRHSLPAKAAPLTVTRARGCPPHQIEPSLTPSKPVRLLPNAAQPGAPAPTQAGCTRGPISASRGPPVRQRRGSESTVPWSCHVVDAAFVDAPHQALVGQLPQFRQAGIAGKAVRDAEHLARIAHARLISMLAPWTWTILTSPFMASSI